jgi:hypothetical protein
MGGWGTHMVGKAVDVKSNLSKLRSVYLWTSLFCLFAVARASWILFSAYRAGKFDAVFPSPTSMIPTNVVVSERADLIYVSLCLLGVSTIIGLNLLGYVRFDLDRYFDSLKFPGSLFGREMSDVAIGRMFFASTIGFAIVSLLMSDTLMELSIKRISS